jgi:hypothetical protein
MLRLKFRLFIGYILLLVSVEAQQSEILVPKEASTVFSINNINLLKKLSLDELVTYDFMEEIHQELFDGSTSGKTLKDAGLDFEQRLNIFYGKTEEFEVTGFSFGVKDKIALFEVFDDFEFEKLVSGNIEQYASFFNTLVIDQNSGLLIRVQPQDAYVTALTDSVWYSRGNDNPFADDYGTFTFDDEPSEFYDEGMDKLYDDAYDMEKNYWEIRDSVLVELQLKNLDVVINDLMINGNSLYSMDKRFANQLSHESEGVFYLDNSRNIINEQGLWYFQTMYPIMNDDLKSLYAQNIMLGDLTIDSNEINFQINANYGEDLGSIYTEMNNNKLNKDFLRYIPDYSPAFMLYNIDIRKAYDQAFDIVLPLLKSQRNMDMVMNVLAIQLMDQLVDKKSFFNAYKGGMFATFNGVEKVRINKVEYVYDDENFDYSEIETESDEEIPVFTIGFASERPDLCQMILEDFSRLTSRIQKMDGYWKVEDAILDATPVYIFCTKKIFMISNDISLIDSNLKGYGNRSISGKRLKKLKKSGFLYANVDIDEAIEKFPLAFLDEKQKRVIERLQNQSGLFELSSSDSELDHTTYTMRYGFEGDGNFGRQLLDMINSLYILSK